MNFLNLNSNFLKYGSERNTIRVYLEVGREIYLFVAC